MEGNNTKRPDIVLYVNGIAVGMLELKRSTVSVAEGIRQNLVNQKREFIRSFFTTVQLVMAGNDTEGLRYGVIGTPEKHWLQWKEAGTAAPDTPTSALLRELGHLCVPNRLLELIHDFVVFDAGVKKICRHNQYFGVKAAQESRAAAARAASSGIPKAAAKSLTMVWLAKWIREHKSVDGSGIHSSPTAPNWTSRSRRSSRAWSEDLHRTKSGADLGAACCNTSRRMADLLR